MYCIKLYLGEQIYRFTELPIAFRRKAHDNVGAQGDAAYPAAYLRDELAIILYGITSPHCFQNIVITRLNREAYLLTNLLQGSYYPDELSTHVLRVIGQKAYTDQSINSVQLIEQIGQVRSARQVIPVRIYILSQ